MGFNHSYQTRPWNQLLHAPEKLLFAGLATLVGELAVSEGELVIHG